MVKVKRTTGGEFIRAADLKDGVTLRILGEGSYKRIGEGQKAKDALTIPVEFDGEQRQWSPNQSSINVLIEKWGDDTANWVDRTVRIEVQQMLVFGKQKNVPVAFPYSPDEVRPSQQASPEVAKSVEVPKVSKTEQMARKRQEIDRMIAEYQGMQREADE